MSATGQRQGQQGVDHRISRLGAFLARERDEQK
jgi:hypothetical protein